MEGKIIKRKSLGYISVYMFLCMASLISMMIIAVVWINYDSAFLLHYILFNNSSLITFIIVFSLVGTLLGIISIIKDNNKKKLAKIGTVLNGILAVCFVILMLLYN